MSWLDGGDKHTGWRIGGPDGKPVTDKEAAELIDTEDRKRGVTSHRTARKAAKTEGHR